MPWYNRLSFKQYALISVAIIAVFAGVLFLMGQVPICKCGYVKLWHGVTYSSENSQHLSDWYTFSHIIHGFAFYGLARLLFRKWPVGLWLIFALILETGCEIFENTDFIINRYREVTISLDYYGDSIINSVFDVLFMVLGFFMARKLPIWTTVLLIILMEVFVGYWIRDNLTLNIVMLLWPLDVIKTWQTGG